MESLILIALMLGLLYLAFRAVRFVLNILHRICLGGFSVSLRELVLAILIALFLWNVAPFLIVMAVTLFAGMVNFVVSLLGGI